MSTGLTLRKGVVSNQFVVIDKSRGGPAQTLTGWDAVENYLTAMGVPAGEIQRAKTDFDSGEDSVDMK